MLFHKFNCLNTPKKRFICSSDIGLISGNKLPVFRKKSDKNEVSYICI